MNATTLQLRRLLGTPRRRHDAEAQLAGIHRHQLERRLEDAVRTLDARDHDLAGALRDKVAAESSLRQLMSSSQRASSSDRNAPIAVATDLLGIAEHDLRLAQRRRDSAADEVAHWRKSLETLQQAVPAERRRPATDQALERFAGGRD